MLASTCAGRSARPTEPAAEKGVLTLNHEGVKRPAGHHGGEEHSKRGTVARRTSISASCA
jgi:hypothetical protein